MWNRFRIVALGAFAIPGLAVPGLAWSEVDLPGFDAYFSATPQNGVSPNNGSHAITVKSYDEQRNVPNIVWAGSDHAPAPSIIPAEAALWYLENHLDLYGVKLDALQNLKVMFVNDTGRGGILVSFRQQQGKTEVFRTDIKVLMDRSLNLVAITGRPVPPVLRHKNANAETVSPQSAIEEALLDLYGPTLRVDSPVDTKKAKAGYRYFGLQGPFLVGNTPYALVQPARIKSVYFPMPDGVEKAWFLEVNAAPTDSTTSDYYAYVISANDGSILYRENLAAHASFTYRVWSEPEAPYQPLAGPIADWNPHPAGYPDGQLVPFISSNLITTDGFNTSPSGSGDPWLAASATTTTGNNVDAYADHYAPDGYSVNDTRASVTSQATFDHSYDTAAEPLSDSDQVMAAVTQLFILNNYLHDWYYDSGFNEAAGNAQTDNYGRGGVDQDVLLAEGQDSAPDDSVRNNANMSTPADGESPRMQMYLWSGLVDANLDVPALDATYRSGIATFGVQEFNYAGRVILSSDGSTEADDGTDTGTTTDGCQRMSNVRGRIALIDRGSCQFQEKALNAQQSGATGVIIANNVSGDAPGMGNGTYNIEITIPVLSITLEDGQALKSLIGTSTTNVTMFRENDVERDGTIDNTVAGHEWGHYLHHRNVLSCSLDICRAESEGWADFVALHLIHEESDALDGTYAIAQYAGAVYSDSGYYGIRRVAYSSDFSKNAFTFRHIQDGEPLPSDISYVKDNGIENSEVHNAGEVWTTMLWEAYVSLLSRSQGDSADLSYEEVRRRMSDYVVLGMQLATSQPTFTEQRDGILAAALASDEYDFLLIAEAFARRGAGTCAVAPEADSTDFIGVVESYDLKSKIEFQELRLDDSADSCDDDGILDAGETGIITVEIRNGGVVAMEGATATITSSIAGLTFPAGSVATFETIDPLASSVVSIPVALSSSFSGLDSADIEVELSHENSCNTNEVHSELILVNADDVPESSTTDTFDSQIIAWEREYPTGPGDVWQRTADDDQNFVMFGVDSPEVSDSLLISPGLDAVFGAVFSVTFDHRHEFESSADPETGEVVNWDGGAIEVSNDGGNSWDDVSAYGVDAQYNGVLYAEGLNPIRGQNAYTSTNASWPDFDTVTLNFGSIFAGQTVLIRFRLGTDEAVGAYGWDLDNISVTGISNLPFPSIVEDTSALETYFADADGDGYGNPDSSIVACSISAGYVTNSQDCNDTDAQMNPDTDEVCDGLDNNCNGKADENAIDATYWYRDADGDGYGDELVTNNSCEELEGYILNGGDCDDSNGEINPEGIESCDTLDNDCNGFVDDEPIDGNTYYADFDNDGYGSVDTTTIACSVPEYYSENDQDCDDTSDTINPGASEVCDQIDNDCDSLVDDDALDALEWYLDADGDGYGTASTTTVSCLMPEGYVENTLDCNDANAAINPDAAEVCDETDNDCDGSIDEDVANGSAYYPDLDGDGYGSGSTFIIACGLVDGYAANSDDCNDADETIYPGAPEYCDSLDNNCNGLADEQVVDGTLLYEDADEDGYGNPDVVLVSCYAVEDYVDVADDCDDKNADTNPDSEVSETDGIDHNCDGTIDGEQTPTPGGGDDDSPTGDDDSPTGDDDSPTGDDDSPTGDDDSPTGDDDSPTGDDDSPTGDDDSPTGDDDSPTGDDDSPAGDDDSPVGDDDSPVGDDDSPVGDDDSPTGDDDSPTGDDDSPTGDDDSPTGDDDSPNDVTPTEPGDNGDDSTGCNCNQKGNQSRSMAPSAALILLGMLLVGLRKRGHVR